MICKKIILGGQEFSAKTKTINGKNLTSDCWPVQFWGLPYCSGFGDYDQMCEYLGTEKCGGKRIRKKIFAGKYPRNGLPDVSEEVKE